MIEFKNREENLVDAIENSRIVKVSEDYAKREGLLILRKSFQVAEQPGPEQKRGKEFRRNKGFIGMEDLRKPLNPEKNGLLKELVENFHWVLAQKRRSKLLTRKKVASDIGEEEISIKMAENGVLPANNFILINKLESYYGIILRRNRGAWIGQREASNIAVQQNKENEGSVQLVPIMRTPRTPAWVKRREHKKKPEIELIEE